MAAVPDTTPTAELEPSSKGALTRSSILAAAVERFGREGYRSASVADIARDAGVGGTVTYAYFPNKEALFLAAVDEDVAGVVSVGLASIVDQPETPDWRESLVLSLLAAVEDHPLARRLLAGLEPEVTARVLEIPALADLRKVCAARLEREQLAGTVRADIDPTTIANGIVAILLSLLMSLVQLGEDLTDSYAADVSAVFAAAIDRPPPTGSAVTPPTE